MLENKKKLTERQNLILRKIATYGTLTQKMLALYFAVNYPSLKDKLQGARNTIKQLLELDLIERVSLGFGAYRIIYILSGSGKKWSLENNIYYIKTSKTIIYKSTFRHQIILTNLCVMLELLNINNIKEFVPENLIISNIKTKKYNFTSVPDYIFVTNKDKFIISEYEKSLKSVSKMYPKIYNYPNSNTIDTIYYFVSNAKKVNSLKNKIDKTDILNYDIEKCTEYDSKKDKIKIIDIEAFQKKFLMMFDCLELENKEIYL